jgi:prepilin-type processing-associated H-X9-DG protein
MQFRLSTLFLVFFNVAASLALFGVWGLWVSAIFILAVLRLNHTKYLGPGIFYAFLLIFIGIICPGLMFHAVGAPHEARKRARCLNNLKQIGLALLNYHEANGHFPTTNTVDQNGKPLFSWRVEILPMMDHGFIYNSLKKDELWNSSQNAKILGKVSIEEYKCPSDVHGIDDFTTNYIAVIGPGTAWREDGPVKLSDLPDGGAHTVMLLEIANSGMHWAEPCDISVDKALERMKTGKGLGISSGHPSVINILFADGSVRCLSKDMPISAWEKLFDGKIDIVRIEAEIDESATDIADLSFTPREGINTIILEPKIWPYILSFVVWLFSVVLLFRRAVKSRRKHVTET